MAENMTHPDLIVLTEWMARHDFPADDLAYAVARPWKYVDFLARARADRGPEDD